MTETRCYGASEDTWLLRPVFRSGGALSHERIEVPHGTIVKVTGHGHVGSVRVDLVESIDDPEIRGEFGESCWGSPSSRVWDELEQSDPDDPDYFTNKRR